MNEDQALDPFWGQSLEDAKKSYEQILNRLWAGNIAGVFAILAATGPGKFSAREALLPMLCFLLGLVALFGGAGVEIIRQARYIQRAEEKESMLDMPATSFERPSKKEGLRLGTSKAVTTFMAAVLLVIGILSAILIVLFHTMQTASS